MVIQDSNQLARIEVKIDVLTNNLMKVMFALIGVIAASIGLKFVGSPTLTIISTYIALFVGAFALSSTVYYWKHIVWPSRLFRLAIIAFVVFSTSCRSFLFESAVTLPPVWYAPTVDSFFIVICALMAFRVWNHKGANEKKHS